MWLMFLITGSWLSGALFVPVLILLRWMGARFKRLHWLVKSRRSWVLIWGCYGAIKIIGLAIALSVRFPYSDEEVAVGWSAYSARYLLDALHVRTPFVELDVIIVVLVTALFEGAVCCGLAALAWWCFEWATRKTDPSVRVIQIQRYVVSLLFSGWLLGVANKIAFERPPTCFDCFEPFGVPWHFYHEGGFAGGAGFIWHGVIGDFLLVVTVGLITGLMWNLISRPLATHIEKS